MPSPQHSTSALPPAGPLLTDHLRHWAEHRAQQRAFTYVEFPEPGSAGLHHTLGWQRLEARARAIAGRIASVAGPGDRAALLLPQGLDYAAAFLGCLYASVVAVPLFGLALPGHEGRLAAVLEDCEPACIVTDAPSGPAVVGFLAERRLPERPVVYADSGHADRQDNPVEVELPERPEPDDIAYLQYTSGSTRAPTGVVISHANVVANARQAIAAFGAEADRNTTVGWLPLFHDMGLVLSVAAPVVGGFPTVLMDPVAFLEEPGRWLRLLGAYRGTITAAPNFAYDYCVSRIDEEEIAELRLDRVKVLMNGSEPVRPGTVSRFTRTFEPAGLAPEALCPAYGLAEATVFVTTDSYETAPTVLSCDSTELAIGRLRPAAPAVADAPRLVSCGTPVGQELRIADPQTGAGVADGEVGEILLRGPNVGLCYWKRADLSAETFGSPGPDDAEDGAGWLRTGDLGAIYDEQLYVTGRLKDLIIVDGRNHYPQDIEETVQSAVAAVRRDRLAAFSVPRGEAESVVVVAEHRRDVAPTAQEAAAAVHSAATDVWARHGLSIAELVFLAPGLLPRTSSGKVARSAARARYLNGDYVAATAEVPR
ncbi:fatty acyl-AMP ligase [Streptomyces sp. NPDC051976]|uniref:fatty acyl-AMP ligase n=1 Tax=Streptomyces sp. NPDC051976 TaxID=3154947 RepID=UPI00341D9EDA